MYENCTEISQLQRLHQEDFCQALPIMPDHKYESEGGPDLKHCVEILDQCSSQPILDKQRLLSWVIFNTVIGNADGHAKNISLLYKNDGIILAPFYDLISTLVYASISKKLAMKIGGENRFDWIMQRHWERLAADFGVKKAYLKKQVFQIANSLRGLSSDVKDELKQEGVQSTVFDKVSKIIEKQAQRIEGQMS